MHRTPATTTVKRPSPSPARPARTRQTVIAVVTLIVISQVLAFLFIEAAL